ncbi:hypothetical protein [Enterovibrio sp. 27052020O]|uniref:hypothetical protein n=1 Tax=Enterovibrio sp. 27052020O TaxID=3241166 RepID=UPI00388E8EAE
MANHRVLTELMGQGANLSVPRILVRFFKGQFNTAAVMSQLVFWSGKSSRKDGWFYKSQTEIADELCLSRDQVKREIKKIKTEFEGVVSTKLIKADGAPTTHFKIELDQLLEALTPVCAESPNRLGGIAQSNGRNRPIYRLGESAQSITDPIQIRTTDLNTYVSEKPSRSKKKSKPLSFLDLTNLESVGLEKLNVEAWEQWLTYKRDDIKVPYKTSRGETAKAKALIKLSGGDIAAQQRLVDNAIDSEWKGIYALPKTVSTGISEADWNNTDWTNDLGL